MFYFSNRFYRNYFSAMPMATYVGAAAYHNMGDKMLYMAIRDLLKPLLLAPTAPKGIFKSKFANKVVELVYSLAVRGHRKPHASIMGGGTLLNNGAFFSSLKKCYQPGEPLIVFGTGCVDTSLFKNRLMEENEIYRNALMVGVRDPYAQRELKKIDIDSTVIGDPVLHLCHPRPVAAQSKTVGINIGYDRVMIGEQKHVSKQILHFINDAVSNGWKVEFFAMNDRDVNEIRKVTSILQPESFTVWSDYLDIDGFLERVLTYTAVVGQRLHAVVTASGLGIPCISLSYLPKCNHYMESVGMERFCINTDKFTAQDLIDRFTDIQRDYDKLNEKLVRNTNVYRQKQKNFALKTIQLIRTHIVG
jgi:polysaccharide pyruvyl transferase WcaK-like protein